MKPIVKYIEHKPAEHTDRATAWIARVWPSTSGRTLYFNDMALKRCSGYDSNHYDLVSGEDYWVSGVKKTGSNRQGNGGGPIYIEKSLAEWYEAYVPPERFQRVDRNSRFGQARHFKVQCNLKMRKWPSQAVHLTPSRNRRPLTLGHIAPFV